MNTLLAFMTYSTIALVGMLIFSFILNSYKYADTRNTLQWISGVCLILIALFGWGAIGCAYPLEEKNFKIDGELSIGEKSITIDDYQRDNIYYFDKKIDFDNITDSTTFYIRYNYNMYGGIAPGLTNIYYRIDTVKYWGEIWKIKE